MTSERELPVVGSRWHELGSDGVYTVAYINQRHICLSRDGGKTGSMIPAESWPGDWQPVQQNDDAFLVIRAQPGGSFITREPLRVGQMVTMDMLASRSHSDAYVVSPFSTAIPAPGPTWNNAPSTPQDVLNYMLETERKERFGTMAMAFAAVGEAMRTPKGIRVLAPVAVEKAVSSCPASLNRDAYRAMLVHVFDEANAFDWSFSERLNCPSAIIAYATNTLLLDIEYKSPGPFGEVYLRALERLQQPASLGRPAKWSQCGTAQKARPR